MATTTVNPASRGRKSACCCPACTALECLERPLFQAGQLLTEADLNSLENYVVAKNRLHNRYLHGPGVVCGMQVVCNDCEGWVKILPGYAIDACGNDVVVCEEYELNLLKAIRECCEDRSRKRPRDCEPYRPKDTSNCTQDEQHWCIAIEYVERQGRPIAPLRTESAKSCSACGCGGHGGCNCGCHGKSSSKAANGCCATAPKVKTPAPRPSACEPTRIVETFKVCVFEQPADGCSKTDQTLFDKIRECIRVVRGFVDKRVPGSSQKILAGVALAQNPNAATGLAQNPQQVYTAFQQGRQALVDLFTENPFGVRCHLMQLLRDVDLRMPNATDDVNGYTTAAKTPVYNLGSLLAMYLIDCICMAILPGCAPEPCDNRLVLACVTVRKGEIEHICNFSCRQFAGAFPSLYHWLSIVPILPALSTAIERICCSPNLLRKEDGLKNGLVELFQRFDPNGQLRQAFFDADFALPKWIGRTVAEGPAGRVANAVSRWLFPKEVNLGALVGQNVEAVQASLRASGVNMVERTVVNEADVPWTWLKDSPFASRGETVMGYRSGNQIVGFGPVDTSADLAGLRAEVQALREQVEQLRGGVR